MAYGALGLLLAEAVPGAKFTEGHADNENSRVFRLVLPSDAKLSDQSKTSLEKLKEVADDVMYAEFTRYAEYLFFLSE